MRRLAILAALAVGTTLTASADTINGTMTVFGTVTPGPSNNLSGTVVTPSLLFTVGGGTGDFSTLIGFNLGLGGVVNRSNVPTSLVGFTFNFGFGSFVADQGGTVISATNSFWNIVYLGTFTPAGTLSSFDPEVASFNLTLTQNGGPGSSIGYTGVLAAPPVPEPSTYAMMGTALAGLAFIRFRRK